MPWAPPSGRAAPGPFPEADGLQGPPPTFPALHDTLQLPDVIPGGDYSLQPLYRQQPQAGPSCYRTSTGATPLTPGLSPPSLHNMTPCSFLDAIPGGDDGLQPIYLHQPQADPLLIKDQYWRHAANAYENPPSPCYTTPCSFPDAIPGGNGGLHPLYLHQPQADPLLLQDQYWRYARDAYESQDYPPPSPRYMTPCSSPYSIPGSNDRLKPLYPHQPQAHKAALFPPAATGPVLALLHRRLREHGPQGIPGAPPRPGSPFAGPPTPGPLPAADRLPGLPPTFPALHDLWQQQRPPAPLPETACQGQHPGDLVSADHQDDGPEVRAQRKGPLHPGPTS